MINEAESMVPCYVGLDYHEYGVSRRKPANVVSAAIANRWLRRLFHEMVTIPKLKPPSTSAPAQQTGAGPGAPRPRIVLNS